MRKRRHLPVILVTLLLGGATVAAWSFRSAKVGWLAAMSVRGGSSGGFFSGGGFGLGK